MTIERIDICFMFVVLAVFTLRAPLGPFRDCSCLSGRLYRASNFLSRVGVIRRLFHNADLGVS